MYRRLHCCIIGQTSLALQCAEILLQAGHSIQAVITSYSPLKQWSEQNHIHHSDSFSLLTAQPGYDYLFSIVNDVILPVSLLRQPRYFAINFHDSLLPRYAGVHATSWAILNGETEHGVTWHVMREGVDAGEILKQTAIPIDSDETAFSLNIRCHEKAKQLFNVLVTELATNTYALTAQNLDNRTYYGRYDKPSGNGLIDWRESAHSIDCLVRALQFGNHDNFLCAAKVMLFDKIYLVKSVIVTSQRSTEKPGAIVNFTSEYCQIATGTYDVFLAKLDTMDDEECDFSRLYLDFLKKNKEFINVQPDAQLVTLLSQKSALIAKSESFWINQIKHIDPLRLPFMSVNDPCVRFEHPFQEKQNKIVDITIAGNLLDKLKMKFPAAKMEIILLSVLMIYFYRTTQQKTVSIGMCCEAMQENSRELWLFFSGILPFTITFKDNMTFDDVLVSVMESYRKNQKNNTFSTDIFARMKIKKSKKFQLPVGVSFSKKYLFSGQISKRYVNILISGEKNKIIIYANPLLSSNLLKKLLKDIGEGVISLVNAIVLEPKNAITHFEIMSSTRKVDILYKWNMTTTDYPYNKTVHEIFEEQAEKTPNDVAIVYRNQQLTYGQLNQKANSLARYLRQEGVVAESRVGVCMDRGIDEIIALLSILKAGGTYVPISPDYPGSRIQFIIKDGGCKVLLMHSYDFNKIRSNLAKVKIILLDVDLKVMAKISNNNFREKLSSENIAYIMYTSGSTGKPKGVEISHRNILRLVKNSNYIHIKKTDNMAHLVNIYFDPSILEIWGALLNGAKLTIFSKNDLLNLDFFSKKLLKNNITVAVFVTAIFNQFVQNIKRPLTSIRRLIIGGECLSAESVKKFFQINKNLAVLVNAYGPVENTTMTTFYEIKDVNSIPFTIPIGKPISNTQVYILDKNLQPLPIGYTGELLTGGDGLACGYLNQPELTKTKFIKNPFSSNPNDRLYKTGDLARWLPDGNIEYLGRIDDQVKIRGFRITLGEVEHALLSYSAIAQAVVLVDKKPSGQLQLIAFLVTQSINNTKVRTILNVDELKYFMAERLPDYMVPTSYLIMETFPLTSNGKVDKKMLLEYAERNVSISENYQPPETPTEKQLIILWENVLCIKKISITDDFFELGGDSILAMQLVARANIKFGLTFTVKDLINHPTIISLAEKISVRQEAEIFIDPSNLSGEVALMPIQHWFFAHQFEHPEQWSQACLLTLDKSVESEYFIATILHCLKQHDTLYLRYRQEESQWRQYYVNEFNTSVIVISVPLSITVNLDSYIDQIGQLLQSQFDLSKGPLVGVAIFVDEVTKKPMKALLVIHHLLIDGVSWRILLSECANSYPCFAQQQMPPKISNAMPFSRWSNQLQQMTESNFFAAESILWQENQQKFKPLPQDFNHGPNSEISSEKLAFCLDSQATLILLGTMHRVYRTHIHDVLLAALLKIFSDWTQQNTLLVDLESHGRTDDILGLNSTNTVGWFTHLFPIALTLTSASWEKLLPDIKQQLQRMPSQSTQAALTKSQISFNYWGKFTESVSKEQCFQWDSLKLLAGPDNQRTHLINVDCMVQEGEFVIVWTYSRNHYLPGTIANLGDHYVQALREVIQHCLTKLQGVHPVNDFPLVNLTEQQLRHMVSTQAEGGIQNIYPLTPTQQGLVFEQCTKPNMPFYQVQVGCTLRGKLELLSLKKALGNLVQRHEMLRSYCVIEGINEPVQVIQKTIKMFEQVYDLRSLSNEHQQSQLQSIIAEDRQKIIGVHTAPLFCVSIIMLADDHYQLIWHFNHIILDGWSFAILLTELRQYYQAEYKNAKAVLPKALPFSEYILWLQQKDCKQAQVFWQDYLQGFDMPNDLSALGLKAANEKLPEIAFSSLLLSKDLSDSIKHFSSSYSIRLNSLFQGVWGILLYRYLQMDDIVFGMTVSGRAIALPNMVSRVGLFINTLPLRLKFDASLTVLNYLQHVQNQVLALFSYEDVALSDIRKWSALSEPGQSLFDSMVVFENYPQDKQAVKQDICTISDIDFYDPTHYGLTLAIFPGDCIRMKFGYDATRIKKERVENLLAQLEHLLNAVINHTSLPVSRLPLLSAVEYQQFLVQQKQQAAPPLATVITHFENQVKQHPTNIAVNFCHQALDYSTLNKRANQLARYLQSQGVTAESKVAVFLPRNNEWIICLLAIWKAGGVYVPVDVKLPVLRVRSILHLTQPDIVITTNIVLRSISSVALKNAIQFLLYDELDLSNQADDNLHVNVMPQQLAYILHTSGTTGVPKGIAQEHKTLTNLLQWQIGICKPATHRNIAQFSNISFDVSLQEIVYALGNGYALYVVAEETKQSLTALVDFLVEYHIDQLFLPTALLESFCEAVAFSKPCLNELTDIFVAGEALKISSSIQTFFYEYPQVCLTNQYGPTETHVVSSYRFDNNDIAHWPTFAPIGKAIDQVQLYVLDKNGQLLPAEVPGELYVGGLSLARYYVGDLEQTVQRFSPIQLGNEPPFQRLYKTGDRVLRRLDGQLEYLGRFDEQVKIRGFRIELAEIEACLVQLPNIRQCVVIKSRDAQQLIAYVVTQQHAEDQFTLAQIKRSLAEMLPDYMMPAHFVLLDKLPLNANGKLDKKALPEPEVLLNTLDNSATLFTVYEERLAEIWAKILGVKPVDRQQNFFNSGGHSLKSLRLLLEIERQFSVKLFINDLFLAPTLHQLGDKIQQLQASQILTQQKTVDYHDQSLPFPIVNLQSAGDKTPLFLIHPIGGTVFWFVELARCLGKERPVYGIQDPSILQNMLPVFNSMEELASFYLHCIKQIQPKGPYLLAGASFGATCAFEIARQLIAAGEQVEFVGLLDGWAFYPTELQNQAKFEQLMHQQCSDLYQRFQLNQLEDVHGWIDLQWQRSQLLWRYVLKQLDAPLVLFKAEELQTGLVWSTDHDNGWGDFSTKPVSTYLVPGNHETMFYMPNVPMLANKISEAI